MSDAADIMDTLDAYADAYCAKDLDRLMAVFAEEDAVSLIGTGADELCSGRAAIAEVFRRNFREATATRFEWGWNDVAVHGDAAVVAMALRIHLEIQGEALVIPVRWTVSLIRKGTNWKWIHRHASAAAVTQREGSAYPTASD